MPTHRIKFLLTLFLFVCTNLVYGGLKEHQSNGDNSKSSATPALRRTKVSQRHRTTTSGLRWLKGHEGATCDETCARLDLKCDADEQAAIDTYDKLNSALLKAGYRCKSNGGGRHYAESPFVVNAGAQTGDCYYSNFSNGEKPDCRRNQHQHHHPLCACVPEPNPHCDSRRRNVSQRIAARRSRGSNGSGMCLDSKQVADEGVKALGFGASVLDALSLATDGSTKNALSSVIKNMDKVSLMFGGAGAAISLGLAGFSFMAMLSSGGEPECKHTLEDEINDAIEKAFQEKDAEFATAITEDYHWLLRHMIINSPYDPGTTTSVLYGILDRLRALVQNFDKGERMFYGGLTVINMAYELISISLAIAARYTMEEQGQSSFWTCENTIQSLKGDLEHITENVIMAAKVHMDGVYSNAGEYDLSVDSCYGETKYESWKVTFKAGLYLCEIPETIVQECCSEHRVNKKKCYNEFVNHQRIHETENKLEDARTQAKNTYWNQYEKHYDVFMNYIKLLGEQHVIDSICVPARITTFAAQTLSVTSSNKIGTITDPSNEYIVSFNVFPKHVSNGLETKATIIRLSSTCDPRINFCVDAEIFTHTHSYGDALQLLQCYARTTPSGLRWLKGHEGATCDETCARLDLKCAADEQAAIDTEAKLNSAFLEAGYQCKSMGGARNYPESPFSTGVLNKDCFYSKFSNGGNKPDCTRNRHQHHSPLCACVLEPVCDLFYGTDTEDGHTGDDAGVLKAGVQNNIRIVSNSVGNILYVNGRQEATMESDLTKRPIVNQIDVWASDRFFPAATVDIQNFNYYQINTILD